jgi:predicted NAD/FAD-dependent oxidoreductase
METKRMNSCILGAGVSGSFFSYLSGLPVYEKARFPGGRTSHSASSGAKYDFGATILHKEIGLSKEGESYKIELSKFIHTFAPNCTLNEIRGLNEKYYLDKGINQLSLEFTKNRAVFMGHKATSLERQDSGWKIIFENKDSIFVDSCIISFPIPQTLAILPEDIRIKWDDFFNKKTEYRSCLTLTGLWEKNHPLLKEAFSNLPQTTFLIKEKEIDYFSIESEKYNGDYHVILVQFSEEFSRTYFDDWMDDKKIPGQSALQHKDRIFSEVFSRCGIDYTPPKEIRVHRWKFSSPMNTLFGQEDSIHLDSLWEDYIELCRREKIWLISDLIFGKRVLHSLLGTLLVWEEFSGENKWKDLL